MKNKILILFMICSIMIVSSGCEVSKDSEAFRMSHKADESRFVETGQYFTIGSRYSFIVEDTKTHILYIYTTGNGGGITPWLDENGQPMKADSY